MVVVEGAVIVLVVGLLCVDVVVWWAGKFMPRFKLVVEMSRGLLLLLLLLFGDVLEVLVEVKSNW